jgi:hypothetical protein
LERLLRARCFAELLGEVLGERSAVRAKAHPKIIEQARAVLLADIVAAKQALAPRLIEHWAFASPNAVIQAPATRYVHARSDAERRASGWSMVAESDATSKGTRCSSRTSSASAVPCPHHRRHH